jgi:hypothetical protein
LSNIGPLILESLRGTTGSAGHSNNVFSMLSLLPTKFPVHICLGCSHEYGMAPSVISMPTE